VRTEKITKKMVTRKWPLNDIVWSVFVLMRKELGGGTKENEAATEELKISALAGLNGDDRTVDRVREYRLGEKR